MKLQEIFTDLIEKGLGNIKYFKTIPGTKISYEVLYSQVSHGLGLRIGLRITKKVPTYRCTTNSKPYRRWIKD